MSIDTVSQAIATVAALISGVTKVYEDPPRGKIPDANLPCFVVRSGRATYDWVVLGSDMNAVTRDYTLQFLLIPQPEMLDTEGEAQVSPWIETIKDHFAARPQLGRTAGIQRSILMGDSGPVIISWANTNYWGVEFQIRVMEYDARTYADYE